MKRLLSATTLIVILLISTISGLKPAYAQTNGTLERITLSPAYNKLAFDAGQTSEGSLTIINDGQTAYTFALYARPFSVNNEAYNPNFTTVNEQTQAYQWVQFQKSQYTLNPGQRVEAPYTITVPKSAASGGHYAVLFAETQPPVSNTASVARKKRVGSLLYMTVNGSLVHTGSLQSWDVQLWQKKRPVIANVRIKNSGNVHFDASLRASYTNIFGRKQFQLNQQVLIIPGTTRRIPVTWSNSPSFGLYKASGTLSYLNKTENLPNKYIILLPPMYLAFVGGFVVLVVIWLIYRKKSRKPQPTYAVKKR